MYVTITGPVHTDAFREALRRTLAELPEPATVAEPAGPADAWIEAELARPLDTERGPLSSQAVFRRPNGALGWFQRYHRLVNDEPGTLAAVRRVAEHYGSLVDGLPLPPRRRPEARPTRRVRPRGTPVPVRSTGWVALPASAEFARAARDSGGGSAAVLLAATAAYAHRLTGSTEAVVGHLLGTGTIIPVHLAVRPGSSFAELARQAGLALRKAKRRQLSADGVGMVAGLADSRERFALGAAVAVVERTWGDPVDDLLVRLDDNAENGRCVEVRAATRHDRFVPFLGRLVTMAEAPIGTIDLADVRERNLFRRTVNDNARQVPESTVTAEFAARVVADPDAVAVRHAGTELTYRTLDERANRLARLLAGRGAGPERVVAILLPRGADMIVAVLAVLKAGAAYLPVDPDYPAGRIEYLLHDAEPSTVVTTAELAGRLPEDAPASVVLDDPATGRQLAAAPATAPTVTPLPGNAAYVIYTSGSTGTPKGVVIPHRNVVNLAAWAVAELGEEAFSRVLAAASLSFDMSVFEILVPLMAGGAIDVVRNLLSLLDLPNWSGSMINAPPSIYQRVVEAEWVRERAGRYLFCGEPLPGALVRQVHARVPGAAVFNIYGPTEATVYATAWRCAEGSAQDPPIGVPVTNMRCHVLDPALRQVPPDHAGELYLAGDYLARGYANRPALTAQRFVADPFGPPGGRMYRTGDVVRWTAAGELRFVGRVDNQVKVRGVRVELGEIEAAITARPDIASAAVVATGDGQLTAYVVAAGGHQPRPDAIAAGLRAELPEQLVPSEIVVRDALPLNPAGKLDRLALAAEARSGAGQPDAGTDTGGDPVRVLCKVFAGVLGRAAGPDDSFFALGGDSMRSIKLVRRARQAGLVISPEDVFERQTPAALAVCAKPLAGQPATESAERFAFDVLLPLRRSGTQPPLFCVHPVAGVGWTYSALVSRLGAEYPIYALQARGLARDEVFPASVEEMATDYVAEIRRVQPVGPYRLLGWSFGGLVAHAMATRLQDQGYEVDLLALMDSYVRADLPPVEPFALRQAVLAALRRTDNVLSWLDDDRLAAMAGVYENNLRLGMAFRPDVFRGDVTFFAARQDDGDSPMRPDMWRHYVTDGEIHMHHSEFAHDDMGGPESLAEVGRIVAAALRSKE